MIDLSIIIVSYNTRDLLRDCLASIPAGVTGIRAETFVVDNASADGSPEMVESEFDNVALIRNPSNRGFAAANNVALRTAKGRYFVLLNSDTVVFPEALTQLVRFMDMRPNAGYCGPRLLNGDGTHQPSARRFPTLLSGPFDMLSMGKRKPNSRHGLDMHRAHGDRDDFRADWFTGACLLLREEVVHEVGLLDEGYFMYYEETDWCRRMADRGWEGWYVGSAEITHFGGQSVGLSKTDAPFFGNHPAYWVASRRRYMRHHHGWFAMILAETADVVLYTALWLRHRWRSGPVSRTKARRASAALRHLLMRSPSTARR